MSSTNTANAAAGTSAQVDPDTVRYAIRASPMAEPMAYQFHDPRCTVNFAFAPKVSPSLISSWSSE